jgi:hypothetical protein
MLASPQPHCDNSITLLLIKNVGVSNIVVHLHQLQQTRMVFLMYISASHLVFFLSLKADCQCKWFSISPEGYRAGQTTNGPYYVCPWHLDNQHKDTPPFFQVLALRPKGCHQMS